MALLVLFRFDLVTFTYLGIIPLLLFPIIFYWRKLQPLAIISLMVLLPLHIFLLLADLAYYPHGAKHLSYEIQATIPDLSNLIPLYLKEFWYYFLTFLFLVFVLFKVIKRIFPKSYSKASLRPGQLIIYYVTILPFMVILLRGGIQYVPITPSDAFATGDFALGNLALNGTYTVVYTLFSSNHEEKRFQNIDAQDIKILQRYSWNEQDGPPVSSQYPLFRQFKSFEPSHDTINVVLIILESFSSYYSKTFNPSIKIPNLTPFFDSLAQNSYTFSQYYSTAVRSIEAIPSIINGIPNLLSSSFIGSPYEMNTYMGLGHILRRYGYTTAFFHGARRGSMAFDRHLKQAGFQYYFSLEDYKKEYGEKDYDGSWGIYDHAFFQFALNHIKKFQEPFFVAIFSLSNHHPFSLPPNYQWCKVPEGDHQPFFNTYRYTDQVLKEFFHAIWNDADSTRWKRTLFIITSDHTYIPEEADLETKHKVPLLFYAPNYLPVKRDSTIGSHLSLLPTLFDLLHISAWHHSFAPSLFNQKSNHYALFQHEGLYIYKDDSTTLIGTLDKIVDYQSPHPESKDTLFQIMKSLIKATNHLIIANKMAPLQTP